MATLRQTRCAPTGENIIQSDGVWSKQTALRLVALVFAIAAMLPQLRAQTYTIASAAPSFIGAGANGGGLVLTGKLPDFTLGAYQVCFYTGYGSTAAITPDVTARTVAITVPASSIQGVPTAQFTAANGYAFPSQLFIVPTGTACSVAADSTLTNSFIEPIAEPVLGTYSGPTGIPQTNPATSVQAPPTNIVLSGSSFTAATSVTFGTFGSVTPRLISSSTLSVPIPAEFSSSPVGTTAAISLCNTGGYCGTGAALTLTVSALVPSIGALDVSPSPVSTAGTTTLTAQFQKDPQSTGLPEPGVPSGIVTFSAGSKTVSTAALTLDTTAVFVPQTTVTQIATTPAPAITPAAGSYATSQIVTITDVGAAIFYTTDGSAPSASSTPYTGPFNVATTQTITAIAIAAGSLPSSPSSSLFSIFVPTPTSLAFVTQPGTTAINTSIAPAITVAILDQNGNTITNSTAPVSIAFGFDPAVQANLGGTTAVNAVNGIATFSDLTIDQLGNGYTLTATSGSLTSATSTAFNITPYPITVKLFNPLIGVTSTLPGTFTLTHPAPKGGVTVSLSSDQTGFVTVSPATVNVPEGTTAGSFSYTGVAPGLANISASAPGYLAGSSSVTATYSLVSLGTIPSVAPGQTVSLALSLATAAPAGGVTINFTSSNTNVATITSSVFVPAGQRTAAANPQIVGLQIGTTTINATAQGYAPDTRNINVTVVATFSPTSAAINLAPSNAINLTIAQPATTGGITFTLSSDNTKVATVPTSVTIPAGQTSVPVPITGVSNGQTTIRADSPGVTEATFAANVTSTLTVGAVTTGANLYVNSYVSIPSTSPSPVTITVTSSNPAVALLSTSTTAAGTATLTFNNITGNTLPTIYVQGQMVGSSTITASGPGYTNGTAIATVDPSGFVFNPYASNNITTTTFSSPTGLNIAAAILDPTSFNFIGFGNINPGTGPFNVPITDTTTATGTVSPNPVIFHAADGYQYPNFTPGTAGNTTLGFGTAPAGFHAAGNYNTLPVTVNAPMLSFSAVTTGVNLEVPTSVSVPTPPATPETVTVTVTDPTVATISTAAGTAGTASVTFMSNAVPNIYVQGQKIGSTLVTISAAGYTNGTATLTVDSSGFVFNPYGGSTITTTTFSSTTSFNIQAVILDPKSFDFVGFATISPGIGPFSVPISSSNTSAGTVTSPLTFPTGNGSQNSSFQPSAAGMANLTIGAVPGFHAAGNYNLIVATVTAPVLTLYNATTGVNLEVATSVSVPSPPATPEVVTVSVADPTVATISTALGTVGTASVTFMSNAVPNIYVQGQKVGSTMIVASASGYTNGTATLTVDPSSFDFDPYQGGTITTTTFSTPTGVYIYPVIVDPTSFNYVSNLTISPGVGPFSIPVSSSNTNTGTITASPVVFHSGDSSQMTNFQPSAAGTSNITLGTLPAGFHVSGNYTTIVATVSAPALTISNTITGVNLQVATYVNLPVAPPNPVTVTVTSNAPIATISNSQTTAGTTTLTFTNVTTGGSLGPIYVQGQATGTTTLTVSAPGYTNGIANISVYPSGFTYANNYNNGLSTTAKASPINIPVYPSILNTGTLTYYSSAALNPGLGTVAVGVTSSTTAIGTVTSPLNFSGGDTYHYTLFTPLATGTTNINIVQPTGLNFSTPSQSQNISILATVQ